MTLRTRIVAALVFAAMIPMALVIAVFLGEANKRAGEETARRRLAARRQAEIPLNFELITTQVAADRAAEGLRANRNALASVVRGLDSAADAVAAELAMRCGLDRLDVLAASGARLAGFETARPDDEGAPLIEKRTVTTDGEALTLVATRFLGTRFVEGVSAITGDRARLTESGPAACPEPSVEVPVAAGRSLCVDVSPADVSAVRLDILKSFAGVAPAAFLAALAVGLVLAARIARPIRALAERAQAISAQRSRPITLLDESDETRRMTLAFDQMIDALEAGERRLLAAERVAAWEEIAKRLAHEIKNPLSPIQLAVENLQRTRRLAPETFDEALAVETRTILEEVASLRTLVDEFAQFARLPRPHVADCDPRAIVEQALSLYSARIAAMDVTLVVDHAWAPVAIRADAEQIGRVLKNVIANALDAMEGTAERRLSVVLRREDDRAVFEVRDSGRGFDPESLRRVFEPYFTTRADRGGTGLGMAIARRIVVEHGGSLIAASRPEGGAAITLSVPVGGPQGEGA